MNQRTIANSVSLERSASIETEDIFKDAYIKFCFEGSERYYLFVRVTEHEFAAEIKRAFCVF